jgi:hypothetical protein
MAKKLVTRQAYQEFGELWVKTLRNELRDIRPYGKYATGQLNRSINYKLLTKGKDVVNIQLNAEYYLNFIDQGVSGTQRRFRTPYSYKQKPPPIGPLLKWASAKGLPEEVAYASRWTIFRFGLKPTNVITKTIRTIEFRSRWVNKFENEMVQTILDNVKEQFKGK